MIALGEIVTAFFELALDFLCSLWPWRDKDKDDNKDNR